MTPERWQRIEELYHAAYARPAGERAAFLDQACRGDSTLRREVESLLSEPSRDEFLDVPSQQAATYVAAPSPPDLIGHSLGGYRLEALLGEGGMGEVYRSRDEKLGRDVAIKILPRAFTSHPDRLARFEREARMLAALNQPNICAIYGFEQADSVRFLILELVEGDTLAHQLAQASIGSANGGGLPLARALTMARQITDALEAAHDKGIIHRDLKPANIKITPDGVVKVLDFGLAKAVSGDGSAPDLTHAPDATSAEPRPGAVMGTPAYMSPEQARGLPVDKRTDIWSFGCVLYQMLTGRVAFGGDTASDSIAKILERDPDWSALPVTTPSAVRRLLLRCLVKDPKKRLRDIGDVRIELDGVNDAVPGVDVPPAPPPAVSGLRRWLPWTAVAALAVTLVVWQVFQPVPFENPLPSEGFKLLTDWAGSEEYAEISPDGKVVAFIADLEGELDLFSGQVATREFRNLTERVQPLTGKVPILRSVGFFGDSARLWFAIAPRQKMEMPSSGGEPSPFLVSGAHTPAWSSDGRLVFFNNMKDDALFLADAGGRNAAEIAISWPAVSGPANHHNHNMVWSPDNTWIYLVHGVVRDTNDQSEEMDIWRVRPAGGTPERLTFLNAAVTFLAILDERTLVFIAPDEQGFGSWLWSLDLGRKGTAPRRIPTGLDQYTSVSASRDRGPVVATRANPTASLWSVPILAGTRAVEGDVIPFRLQTERALAPRYARRAESPLLFYLSARGTGDRVWGFHTSSFEITRGAEGHVSELPAPSPDGSRLAIVVKDGGRRHLAVMNQNGQGSQTLAASLDVRGAPDWSPDGKWIAVGGRIGEETGLFAIAVDGGTPRRLVSGLATDPVWSPKGDFVLYAGEFSGGTATGRAAGAPLRAVRPDTTKYDLPLVLNAKGAREDLRVTPGSYRFLDPTHLVYRDQPQSLDFWLVDLVSGERQQITQLANKGTVRAFDIAPDGKSIVFDRIRQNSDVVLIEPRKK